MADALTSVRRTSADPTPSAVQRPRDPGSAEGCAANVESWFCAFTDITYLNPLIPLDGKDRRSISLLSHRHYMCSDVLHNTLCIPYGILYMPFPRKVACYEEARDGGFVRNRVVTRTAILRDCRPGSLQQRGIGISSYQREDVIALNFYGALAQGVFSPFRNTQDSRIRADARDLRR